MTQRKEQIQREIEKRDCADPGPSKRARTDGGESADIIILHDTEKKDGENTIVLRHGELVVRKRCVFYLVFRQLVR